MDRIRFGSVLIVLMTIRYIMAGFPGTFFWKPRMAIDLSIPTTEHGPPVRPPIKKNIRDGYVVILDGYQAGVTAIAIAMALEDAKPHPHLDVRRASYYTNAYRWGLRHISLIPDWLGGRAGNYAHTHRVWRKRFFYMDRLVPRWMRVLLPFVAESDWEQEAFDLRRFNKYAEPAFGKQYRYPSKEFTGWAKFRGQETIENMNRSDLSLQI